jgi:hypothetical protein
LVAALESFHVRVFTLDEWEEHHGYVAPIQDRFLPVDSLEAVKDAIDRLESR